jgi:hypothetical protein
MSAPLAFSDYLTLKQGIRQMLTKRLAIGDSTAVLRAFFLGRT